MNKDALWSWICVSVIVILHWTPAIKNWGKHCSRKQKSKQVYLCNHGPTFVFFLCRINAEIRTRKNLKRYYFIGGITWYDPKIWTSPPLLTLFQIFGFWRGKLEHTNRALRTGSYCELHKYGSFNVGTRTNLCEQTP